MQKVQNFGSLLQSYALKKSLEELGHEVSFIDIERRESDDMLLDEKRLYFNSERETAGGILSKIKRIDKYAINRLIIKKRAKEQDVKFNRFRKEILYADVGGNNKKYDLCVIGSDEVFNCLNPAAWGFTAQLFGDVTQADKVITYAASCGSTTYDELPDEVKKRIRTAFNNISSFSVRDENTANFVNALTDKPCEINLDPVVIGDFDDEIAKCDISRKVPKHYCIIYSYYNRIHSKDEIKNILRFCAKKGLEPVTIGAPQMWVKNHLVLTPFEALAVFKNAGFVITDTFHGTIFSAKFSKSFAVMVRQSNKNKLLDLVKRLEIENHLIDSTDELEKTSSFEKNQQAIDNIVSAQRKRTFEYLTKSI